MGSDVRQTTNVRVVCSLNSLHFIFRQKYHTIVIAGRTREIDCGHSFAEAPLLNTDIDDFDVVLWLLLVHPDILDHMYHIHTFGHSTEHGMFPIQPWGGDSRDKEL